MPRSSRNLLRLCLLVPVSGLGCTVDQEKEVEQYKKVLNANLLSTDQPFTPGQPLTLRQALDLTNRQNEKLAIEGENYVQALISRQRAAAGFYPTVSLAPVYNLRQNVSGESGNSAGNSVLDVPFTGGINLFNGFSDQAQLKVTGYTIEQQRDLLLNLQERVLLDTAGVYYDILRAERTVKVLENSLELQDTRVRDIEGRQIAGLARPLDVAQTQAQAAATRVLLINARNDVQNGRTTLAYLTNAPVQDSPLIDAFNAPATLPTLEQLQQTATQHRRDLLAASSAILAARQNVEVKFGQYYPSVTLNLDVFAYRESFPDARVWEALLQANLPIFSAGLIDADVRQAWSQFRQSALSESLLRRQVVQEVQLAFQTLYSIEKRIGELQVQLDAAQQALNQADKSYTVGLATNLERITAQDQLLTAQLQITSARFDRTLSYLTLARAIGELRSRLEAGVAATSRPTSQAATQPTTSPVY